MYYIIYKVTNKINGKFYVGSHKTKNLDDNYMGSGKYLNYAITKYGINNFKKDILFVFDTAEEMYAKEAEIVNEDFLATENTYNLKVGGFGGFDYINSNPDKYLTENRLSSLMSPEKRKQRWQKKYDSSPEFREVVRNNLRKAFAASREKYPEGPFKGKEHSNDTKKIMSQKSKKRLSDPTKNSQYGTMWITNGESNRKVKKDSLLPEGWKKGRVLLGV
jgi:hypothetical protein